MIVANTIAIAQRELQSYFANPLAYILAAVFWLISGWFFVEILMSDRGIIQQIIISERMGVDIGSIDVATEFLKFFFGCFKLFVFVYRANIDDGALCGRKKARYFRIISHFANY